MGTRPTRLGQVAPGCGVEARAEAKDLLRADVDATPAVAAIRRQDDRAAPLGGALERWGDHLRLGTDGKAVHAVVAGRAPIGPHAQQRGAAAAEDGSGKRRNAPRRPFRPTEGCVPLTARRVADRPACAKPELPASAAEAAASAEAARFGEGRLWCAPAPRRDPRLASELRQPVTDHPILKVGTRS